MAITISTHLFCHQWKTLSDFYMDTNKDAGLLHFRLDLTAPRKSYARRKITSNADRYLEREDEGRKTTDNLRLYDNDVHRTDYITFLPCHICSLLDSDRS